jgi:hypothetical protein
MAPRKYIPFGHIGCLLSAAQRKLHPDNVPKHAALVEEILEDIDDFVDGSTTPLLSLSSNGAVQVLTVVIARLKDLRLFIKDCIRAYGQELGPPMSADSVTAIVNRFARIADVDSMKLALRELGRYFLAARINMTNQVESKLEELLKILDALHLT